MKKQDLITIPAYDTPNGIDAFTYLSELCQIGLEKRYTPVPAEVQNRLNYESDIIKNAGFADYFLIVWDIIRFAKSQGIMVGPGRGSAAGSIVLYALGVTNIEPIRRSLMFERFINPESVCIPDITIDIAPDGYQKVIDYTVEKYGSEQYTELSKKISFAVLSELDVIAGTVNLIKRTRGIDIDLENIDYNCKEVYDLISSGNTEDVFLLEDEAAQVFMQGLNPDSMEEIIAGITLYRPGVMAEAQKYIRGKKDPEIIAYKHPLLKQTLGVTYGCILYQEQVMEILQNLTGCSLGKANIMRRSINRKGSEQAEAERRNFIYGSADGEIPGCIRNGIDEKTAISIFGDISSAGILTFNKAHAAAYALVAYQMAYLKTFYNREYMEAAENENIPFRLH